MNVNPARGAAGPPDGEQGGTPASASPLLHQRRRPVHLPNRERHNQPVILFVTVCTKHRRTILASERVHATLRAVWSRAMQYRVGRYTIMPDHLHLFCAPAIPEAENVARWIAYWKRLASIALPDLGGIWQRNCWDTQLRHICHYEDKWEYVRENPVRKGLVNRPDDWPYQGCLNELRW